AVAGPLLDAGEQLAGVVLALPAGRALLPRHASPSRDAFRVNSRGAGGNGGPRPIFPAGPARPDLAPAPARRRVNSPGGAFWPEGVAGEGAARVGAARGPPGAPLVGGRGVDRGLSGGNRYLGPRGVQSTAARSTWRARGPEQGHVTMLRYSLVLL